MKQLFTILIIALSGIGCSSHLPVPADHPDYIDYIKTEAALQSPLAQYTLGQLHLFGRTDQAVHSDASSFLQNQEEGLMLIEKAATGGHIPAQRLMGILYGFSEQFSHELKNPLHQQLSLPQDLSKATQWLFQAAASNDPDAIYWSARLAYLEDTVEIDTQKALAQLESQADNGHTLSQTFLAHIYHDGIWANADLERSFHWLQQAALSGDAASQNSLAIYYMRGLGVKTDQKEGVRWFKQAAENGLARAQFNLATCYEQGIGTDIHLAEALILFQLSAAKHNIGAINRLATLYMKGIHVPQDPSEAAIWFQAGADMGDPQAQSHLAYLYSAGLGVNKDPQMAAKLYRDAALQGHLPAVHNLGVAYLKGFGVKESKTTALKLFTTSAQNGYPHSQFLLGKLLMEGHSTQSHQFRYGLYWVSVAAHEGHTDAITYMGVHGLKKSLIKPLPAQAQQQHNTAHHLKISNRVDTAAQN